MNVLHRFEMTPYRVRLALDVLTALVIASVAFALAALTWRLAGHAGTGAITVPAVRPAGAVPDLTPALALAPFGKIALAADAATPTTLQIQLKGIVFARPADLSAAFLASGSEAARSYRIGETVGGATIEAIQMNRVLIRNGGRIEFVAFPDPFAKPAAPGGNTAAAPSAASGAQPKAAPPAPADAAQIIQRLDARPVSGGYQIGENAPPGLRQGDVLQQVNGAALSSPEAARDALTRAQTAGSAQIQIVRDGKPLTMTVPIR